MESGAPHPPPGGAGVMSRALRFASAIVRTWTRLYTWRMPEAVRDARRDEIESDLWESAHDPGSRAHGARQVFVRLALGIPDDLRWRLEEDAMKGSLPLRVFTGVVACVAVLVIWAALGLRSLPLPSVPGAPASGPRAAVPPPPPPPPPLAPGQSQPAAADFQLRYGETSYTSPGGASTPRKIKDVAPIFPPIAVMYGVGGTVTLEATVDEQGRVADARILKAARIFEQPSIDAVKQWEFEPARRHGAPVPVVIGVTVQFTPPENSRRF